jgi:hypothetical protein
MLLSDNVQLEPLQFPYNNDIPLILIGTLLTTAALIGLWAVIVRRRG